MRSSAHVPERCRHLHCWNASASATSIGLDVAQTSPAGMMRARALSMRPVCAGQYDVCGRRTDRSGRGGHAGHDAETDGQEGVAELREPVDHVQRPESYEYEF